MLSCVKNGNPQFVGNAVEMEWTDYFEKMVGPDNKGGCSPRDDPIGFTPSMLAGGALSDDQIKTIVGDENIHPHWYRVAISYDIAASMWNGLPYDWGYPVGAVSQNMLYRSFRNSANAIEYFGDFDPQYGIPSNYNAADFAIYDTAWIGPSHTRRHFLHWISNLAPPGANVPAFAFGTQMLRCQDEPLTLFEAGLVPASDLNAESLYDDLYDEDGNWLLPSGRLKPCTGFWGGDEEGMGCHRTVWDAL